MRNLPIAIALFLLALAPACGNDKHEELIRRVERTADAVCACDDNDCVQERFSRFLEWTEKHAREKPEPAVMKRIMPPLERMVACMVKIAEKQPGESPKLPSLGSIMWAEKPPHEEAAEMGSAERLERIESLADLICLCKEPACTSAPLAEMQKVGKGLADQSTESARYRDAMHRATQCASKILREAAPR